MKFGGSDLARVKALVAINCGLCHAAAIVKAAEGVGGAPSQ